MIRKKRGFTLVELLVVITIIGMLVGLLMPAVQSAREAGRRAQCTNNQHQISLALHAYDSEKGSFPGYVGEYRTAVGAAIKQRKTSWWVALLPHLSRMDLHDLWKDLLIPAGIPDNPLPGDNTVANNPIPSVLMRVGVCPSYSPPTQNDSWLSYRVNVGRITPNGFMNDTGAAKAIMQSIPAEGVFTDQYQDSPGIPNPEQTTRVSLGFIDSKDGTSCTLMLAENSASVPPPFSYPQDGKWAPLLQGADPGGAAPYYQSRNNATILGFNWDDMNPMNPNVIVNNQTPDQKIYSNHPGGVNVSFCDGHQSFLRTDIEPVIYMQLMCPSDRDVYNGGANYGIRDPLNTANPVPPLSEDKY